MFADCDIVQSSYLSRLYVIALELLGLGVQSNNNFFNKERLLSDTVGLGEG